MSDAPTIPGVPTEPDLAAGVPTEPDLAAGILTEPDLAAGVPTEPDLAAERAHEERSERWLFIRQVAIVLVLVALLLIHALLG
jgi:hypothetical protein